VELGTEVGMMMMTIIIISRRKRRRGRRLCAGWRGQKIIS